MSMNILLLNFKLVVNENIAGESFVHNFNVIQYKENLTIQYNNQLHK